MCLCFQVPVSGIYTLWQLCITMGGIEFMKNLSSADIGFDVLSEEPNVTIQPQTGKPQIEKPKKKSMGKL